MPSQDDTPQLGRTAADGDNVWVRDQRTIPDISGDSDRYRRLIDALGVMTSGGLFAEDDYQRRVGELRRDTGFVEILVKTAEALPEEAYEERWALTQLAVDLRHPLVADYLTDLVRRPVPPERSEDPMHGTSTVTEEVILRTTAIEGLSRLDRNRTTGGHDRGESVLEPLLGTLEDTPYLALRRAVWFAVLDSADADLISEARQRLTSRGEEWITTLRRLPVEEAPQADPSASDRDVPPPIDG